MIRKMDSQCCLVNEPDKIERQTGTDKFKEIFKTIACDNGCENLDFEGLERSALTGEKRTKAYYAHPYSGAALTKTPTS